MTTFMLVPGFWLGAWAWDEVAASLRSAGHDVHAVTLPGLAERATEPDVTIESQVDDLVATLNGLHDVVLVGHSGGGPVVAAAAERARDRVAQLVFVDTGPLPEGMSHLDFLPPDLRTWVEQQMAANDGDYPMPDRATLARNGASTEGMDDDTFAEVHRRSTPEPGGAVTGSARRAAPDPSLPKTVIACSFTREQVTGLITAGVPGFAEMGGSEWTFVELATGHWPMFSVPEKLAALLVGVEAGAS